jgi:hypothetical protein
MADGVRSVRNWIGVVAICLTFLFIPIATGAMKLVEHTNTGWLEFVLPPGPNNPCRDFDSRAEAQRYFLRHSPNTDPLKLDRDGDRKVCERFDFSR